MKVKILSLVLIVVAAILTCINPIYPNEMFLQHLGTLILLAILSVDIKRNKWTLGAYLGIASFTLLHVIAARFIYSYVPYSAWSEWIFGFSIDETFGFERNQFDRFVHFAYGIMFFPFAMQVFGKWKGLTVFQTVLVAWLSIQTLSMIYELFEWSLTLVMSNEAADNYNGQQGDWWDPHKDMVLATLGSSVMAVWYLVKGQRK
ncbi:MAG: DUF2238 domain-containing protein [Bacteroidetes bacterium]|nr:DUF2238 domain-containing protein [Bacteroidota bacterium]MBU1720237.1 DUF2238 domain-containing protein [Bacteroidota bacterium]